MTFHTRIRLLVGALVPQIGLALILATAPLAEVHADLFDDIGYTQLQTELGGSTPTGAGIALSQVEAPSGGNYRPNSAHAEFTTKTFDWKSGTSGTSSHATTVGQNYYGDTTSIAPDAGETTVDIDSWEANDWLLGTSPGFLKVGTASAPNVESQNIQNHSWIGTSNDDIVDTNVLRRLDFAINRDGFTVVVGQNNGNSTTLPKLLGQAYNVISVGRTDGNHSHGYTTIDGAGRIKPEIVVPKSLTSNATPVVGAAAALVMEKAAGTGGLGDAANPEAIKAILMAGATKDEFGAWDRTTTRPLDDQYGAGELNIYRSYHILVDNGEQPASGSSTVTTLGWDFNATIVGSNYYFFDVPDGETMNELSALLTWNRVIADGPWIAGIDEGPASTLTNIDLYLHTATGFTLDTLLDSSMSTVDNVEHIYSTSGLTAGRYVLEVVSPTADVKYSLAWYSTVVPEPGTLVLLATGLLVLCFYARRKQKLCCARSTSEVL